jgi:hypothetical protein
MGVSSIVKQFTAYHLATSMFDGFQNLTGIVGQIVVPLACAVAYFWLAVSVLLSTRHRSTGSQSPTIFSPERVALLGWVVIVRDVPGMAVLLMTVSHHFDSIRDMSGGLPIPLPYGNAVLQYALTLVIGVVLVVEGRRCAKLTADQPATTI